MGRHRTPDEKRVLGEQARALRAAGRSRREITAELHVGDDLLGELLRGTDVPDGLRRPRAKDDLRAAAAELRRAGRTYDDIAAELGVSKSTCSLWLRDLPRPREDPARRAAADERRLAAHRDRAARDRAAWDAAGERTASLARDGVGAVSPRDLVVALAVSYWCEGAKRKPWRRDERVQWMNSDPVLVRLFLRGLEEVGVEPDRWVLQLHLHETADEPSARRWWAEQVGVPAESFRPTTFKRHKPLTTRHNTGADYRGCLCVRVRRGRELYRVLEGVVAGLAHNPPQQAVAS